MRTAYKVLAYSEPQVRPSRQWSWSGQTLPPTRTVRVATVVGRLRRGLGGLAGPARLRPATRDPRLHPSAVADPGDRPHLRARS